MKLNHDALKRTHGLLAEIDRVLAAPSIAERVERVLSSAAASVGDARVAAGADIDWVCNHWEAGADQSPHWNEVDAAGDLCDEWDESTECDCESMELIVTPEGGTPYTRIVKVCWQHDKVYPIGQSDYIYNATAASFGCGVVGCVCDEVFERHDYSDLLNRLDEDAAAHFAGVTTPEPIDPWEVEPSDYDRLYGHDAPAILFTNN